MQLSKMLLIAAFILTFVFTVDFFYEEVAFFFKGYVILYFLYGFIYFMFLQLYGGFKIGILRIPELAFSNVMASVISNFIIYFTMSLITYRLLSPWAILACTLVQSLLGMAFFTLLTRLHHKLYPKVSAIMVRSADPYDAHICEKFSSNYTRYIIEETVDENDEKRLFEAAEDYYAILAGNVKPELRRRLLDYCYRENKQLFLIPQISDILLNNAAQFTADDVVLYFCRNRRFSSDQLLLKRVMDIFVSALGLILTSPLMLLAALAIKLEDGGPVLFRQKRLTRNKKIFTLVKFRSMIVDAEKHTGPVRAGENDPRITGVGRFLRVTRIDELPQLWNILKGDMSLVGPRPERPELFEETIRDFPEFAYRLKVKAGLTGYAQLYGKYNTAFEDKVRLDLLYIEKASLVLDLQLLFYTLKIIFMKSSTAGVSEKEAKNR